MTGLCCRCQVRHVDELCCRHGVVCNGDLPGPTELGMSDLGLLGLSAACGLVVAAAGWVGMHASQGWKFAAALVLLAIAAPVIRWSLRFDPEREVDPPAWVGPGRFDELDQ